MGIRKPTPITAVAAISVNEDLVSEDIIPISELDDQIGTANAVITDGIVGTVTEPEPVYGKIT